MTINDEGQKAGTEVNSKCPASKFCCFISLSRKAVLSNIIVNDKENLFLLVYTARQPLWWSQAWEAKQSSVPSGSTAPRFLHQFLLSKVNLLIGIFHLIHLKNDSYLVPSILDIHSFLILSKFSLSAGPLNCNQPIITTSDLQDLLVS